MTNRPPEIASTSTLADALRQAILASGLSNNEIAIQSDVSRSKVGKFLRGEQDLTLDLASRIAGVVGYAVKVRSKNPLHHSQNRLNSPPKRKPRST